MLMAGTLNLYFCLVPSAASRYRAFNSVSDSKESACNAGDLGLIPGLGRSS